MKHICKCAMSLILFALLAICPGCQSGVNSGENSGNVNADWVKTYSDASALIEGSNLIITGWVVDDHTELRQDIVVTKQVVEIERIFASHDLESSSVGDRKQPVEGERIEILQTGGKSGQLETPPFEEAPLLETGKSYLLLLKLTEEGHYLPTGGYQGVGEIKMGKVWFDKSQKDLFAGMDGKELNAALIDGGIL